MFGSARNMRPNASLLNGFFQILQSQGDFPFTFIAPLIVGSLVAGRGLGAVFAMFAVVAVIVGVIVAIFAEETKERMLEEISP